jgi:hypothetical protein
VHCNWLCPSTTALWLLLTHCSLCAWKTANLPTENQVPLSNSSASTKSALQWLQIPSCDILSQGKKTSILKTKHTRLKMMPTKSFVLQTNYRIPCFIKAHGVFKINFQVNKHHRLNTSRTIRSTQHSRQKIINTSRTHLKQHINLPINAHIMRKSAFTIRKMQTSLGQEIQPFLTKPTQR